MMTPMMMGMTIMLMTEPMMGTMAMMAGTADSPMPMMKNLLPAHWATSKVTVMTRNSASV